MEAAIEESSSSTTEVSVQQPSTFSLSSLDEENDDVQEASNDNHMFLMVDDNAGGSARGSSSEENAESPKLQKYGCHPYFNSNMGGHDLQILFAVSLGTTLPSHDVPPFSIAKGYHKRSNQMQGCYKWKYNVDMMCMGLG